MEGQRLSEGAERGRKPVSSRHIFSHCPLLRVAQLTKLQAEDSGIQRLPETRGAACLVRMDRVLRWLPFPSQSLRGFFQRSAGARLTLLAVSCRVGLFCLDNAAHKRLRMPLGPSAHCRHACVSNAPIKSQVSILATAMVIGDGVLTPAISVVSAVSGLQQQVRVWDIK